MFAPVRNVIINVNIVIGTFIGVISTPIITIIKSDISPFNLMLLSNTFLYFAVSTINLSNGAIIIFDFIIKYKPKFNSKNTIIKFIKFFVNSIFKILYIFTTLVNKNIDSILNRIVLYFSSYFFDSMINVMAKNICNKNDAFPNSFIFNNCWMYIVIVSNDPIPKSKDFNRFKFKANILIPKSI